jgi:hypothetical protein
VKYLCLVYPGEDFVPRPEDAPDFAAVLRAMTEAGVYLDSGALQPSSATTTVTLRDGDTLLTDGPFAEIKEQVGGYFLLDCADLDEAVRWAATIPTIRTGGASIEIRPLVEFGGRG